MWSDQGSALEHGGKTDGYRVAARVPGLTVLYTLKIESAVQQRFISKNKLPLSPDRHTCHILLYG